MIARRLLLMTAVTALLVIGIAAALAQPPAQEAQRPAQAEQFMQRYDANGDGRIDRNEFPGSDEAFARLDADDDGLISLDELRAARGNLRDGAGERDADPAQRWQQMLQRHDADNDGRISREEWTGAERIFEMLDANKDGFITEDEALRMGAGPQQGPRGGDQGQMDPAQRWQRMLERFDANKDGAISREEWQGPVETFERLDANRDGVITEDEVVRPADGDRQQRPQRPDPAQTLIRLIDANDDARISRQEWEDFFAKSDENKDGFVTHAELFKQFEELLRPRPEPVQEQ